MTNYEISKNNMYKKVKTFFTQNTALFEQFPRLMDAINQYFSQNNQLNTFIKTQSRVITGIAGGKDKMLADLIVITVRACRKLLVYAKDKNDTDLMAVFDVRAHDLDHLAYGESVERIEGILDTIQDIKDPLDAYRVTADDVKAISDGVDDCKGQQGNPGDAIAARRAATQGIKATIKAMDATLEITDDLIENGYDDEEHDSLVKQYIGDRRIDRTGLRHSGVHAIVSGADGFAEFVTMTVVELNKEAVTDIDGMAEISPMTPGTYHVSFAGRGYVPQTLILTIERGRILAVSLDMKPA